MTVQEIINAINNAKVSFSAMSALPAAANSTTPLANSTGAIGDYLDSVTIIPLTTSPGSVQIKDGTGAAIDIFVGGASSVSTLHSFTIPMGITSKIGGWSIITSNANVKAVATGSFS